MNSKPAMRVLSVTNLLVIFIALYLTRYFAGAGDLRATMIVLLGVLAAATIIVLGVAFFSDPAAIIKIRRDIRARKAQAILPIASGFLFLAMLMYTLIYAIFFWRI